MIIITLPFVIGAISKVHSSQKQTICIPRQIVIKYLSLSTTYLFMFSFSQEMLLRVKLKALVY